MRAGRDYHDVVKKRLKQLGAAGWRTAGSAPEVKVFVDTAPVMEKPLAERAGLGWQGKHTNLVSREHGSWLFLGEVYTHAANCRPTRRTATIAAPAAAASTPARPTPSPRPTGWMRGAASRYLTIEHKGPIPEEFRPPDGQPHLRLRRLPGRLPLEQVRASGRAKPAFLPRAELTAPRLADLAQLDDAGFRQVFSGSPIKRIGRDRFVRNVLTALGNSGDPAQIGVVERLTADDSELVRDAAQWALQRLRAVPTRPLQRFRSPRKARAICSA